MAKFTVTSSGTTWFDLANQLGISPTQLQTLNPGVTDLLQGTVLNIPERQTAAKAVPTPAATQAKPYDPYNPVPGQNYTPNPVKKTAPLQRNVAGGNAVVPPVGTSSNPNVTNIAGGNAVLPPRQSAPTWAAQPGLVNPNLKPPNPQSIGTGMVFPPSVIPKTTQPPNWMPGGNGYGTWANPFLFGTQGLPYANGTSNAMSVIPSIPMGQNISGGEAIVPPPQPYYPGSYDVPVPKPTSPVQNYDWEAWAGLGNFNNGASNEMPTPEDWLRLMGGGGGGGSGSGAGGGNFNWSDWGGGGGGGGGWSIPSDTRFSNGLINWRI